jgi:hypothetical protein
VRLNDALADRQTHPASFDFTAMQALQRRENRRVVAAIYPHAIVFHGDDPFVRRMSLGLDGDVHAGLVPAVLNRVQYQRLDYLLQRRKASANLSGRFFHVNGGPAFLIGAASCCKAAPTTPLQLNQTPALRILLAA